MTERTSTSIPPPPEVLSICRCLRPLPDADRLAPYLSHETVPAGTVVVREGDDDRDMFFVLEGDARIRRGDLELGAVVPGEHFGELALVAGRRRAASIVAATELRVARLTVERYADLAREQPGLGLRFIEVLIAGVGSRLREMTETVGELLQERSLPRRTHVEVRMNGDRSLHRTGTLLAELLPEHVAGRPVVAALVDRRPVALVSGVSSDCDLAPLTTAHWEGYRVYRHSLHLLMLEAARRRFSHLDLVIEHSIGYAQRAVARPEGPPTAELAAALSETMRALVGDDLPLREELWTVDEARTFFASHGGSHADRLLRTWRDPTVRLVSYGQHHALSFGPLCHRTGMLGEFEVVPDDDGVLLVHQRPSDTAPASVMSLVDDAIATSRHTRGMTRDHRRWLEVLGTQSVGEFNQACVEGNVAQLIRVSEGFQEKRIGQIADSIRGRGDAVKVVCIAGPSSSGKTTFMKRLRVQLQVNGVHPIDLSLDDYYVDREATPRDADGEYDYEVLEALRTDLLQAHLDRLLAGERVRTARYDFATGRSHPGGGREIALAERDLLVLEGVHGLNPRLLERIPATSIFRIYLCPLAQLPFDHLTRIHPSDLRLVRRIVRDRHRRGADAAANILRWPSVRRGERRNIYPFQQHADEVFDSSLIYELSVLKVFAERYLLEVPQSHEAYTTAYRLLRVLDRFVTIYPDHVPPTSILREFIGGSGFEY